MSAKLCFSEYRREDTQSSQVIIIITIINIIISYARSYAFLMFHRHDIHLLVISLR